MVFILSFLTKQTICPLHLMDPNRVIYIVTITQLRVVIPASVTGHEWDIRTECGWDNNERIDVFLGVRYYPRQES